MKFTIGEFSRITKMSIKTLRLYHEKEILIPAEVDEFTKYRYYNETNLSKAGTIQMLKQYDFSLAEIKEILDECVDESDILEQLAAKQKTIQNKIDRYNEISHSIEMIIKSQRENEMKDKNEFEVEEKSVDTILIAGYRMKGKYSDVGEGFAKIGKKFGRHINGKPMNLYYDDEYKDDGADFEPCMPVRKGEDTDEISVRELKGGKCVSLIHKGDYEKLGDSYKKIFAYINEKGYKYLIPHREVYIKGPGMIFKGNPKNYLTEIQLIIEE
jgi:DNA-binding transcriptional MerR regulator/DNA gyrase inhibitor GyrI